MFFSSSSRKKSAACASTVIAAAGDTADPDISSTTSLEQLTEAATSDAEAAEPSIGGAAQWVKIPKKNPFSYGQNRIIWHFQKYKNTFFAIL